MIETQDKYDLLVIPGGAKGAETMSKSPAVQELVRRYIRERKFVGMICAGMFSIIPSFQSLLSHLSLFYWKKKNREFGCTVGKVGKAANHLASKCQGAARKWLAILFPPQKNRVLTSAAEFDYSEEPVVVSDYLITR